MTEPTSEPPKSRRYHHGDLREALVREAASLLAERGLAGFSVAEVARRAKVSSAAPYRHFADRESLLAAVAQVTARELLALIDDAEAASGGDATERLVLAAGDYARYVHTHGAGLDLVYLDELAGPRFAELHEDTRALAKRLMHLGAPVVPVKDYDRMAALVEDTFVLAHGYATGPAAHVLAAHPPDTEQVVAKVVAGVRILVAGHRAL